MPKKKPQTILHVDNHECDWFFDSKGNCIGHWCHNDAMFRSEYMGPFINTLGFEIEEVDHLDKRVYETVKNDLENYGYEEEEIQEDY